MKRPRRPTATPAAPPAAPADTRIPQVLDVVRQFRVIFGSVKRHYRYVERRAGVSGAQLWTMERIASHPGLSPGELARELAIHPSTASNLLGRLDQLGLVERRRTSKDHRRVQLYLTESGETVMQRAPRPLKGVLQQALADMTPDNLATLYRRLEDLQARMQVRDSAAGTKPLSDI